jgi:phage terminase large subunit-like protein
VSWRQRQDDSLARYQAGREPYDWRTPNLPGWTAWSARSSRNARWLEANCYVPDGPKAGQKLRLTDHQMEKLRRIYLHADRLPREVILSEPRKNAKTAFASFIVLLHTLGPEAKPFGQVVTAARVKDQAALTYEYCANSIICSPTLSPFVDFQDTKKTFKVKGLHTTYKALSKDAKAQLGKSPAVAIHDELGQVEGPVDELYNNIETAMKAHASPMSITVSTQAPKDGDLLSIRIDNAINNPREDVLLFLSTAPLEPEEGVPEEGKPPEEWAHPPDPNYPYSLLALQTANPELGILCNQADCLRDALNAQQMPSLDASYRNLTLNQRIVQVATFIPKAIWNACAQPSLELPGPDVPIWLGLDLSESGDLTALAAVWITEVPGEFEEVPNPHAAMAGAPLTVKRPKTLLNCWAEGFLPEYEIGTRSRRDRVPYDTWAKKGQLTLVPGQAIDGAWVAERRILPMWGRHNIVKAGFDRWGFKSFRHDLKRAGMGEHLLDPKYPTCKWEPIGMGTASMTPVLKELETRLLNRALRHGNQPVLTMAASNVVVVGDAEARRPSKRTSRARIDPFVAVAIAVGAWLSCPTPARTPRIL